MAAVSQGLSAQDPCVGGLLFSAAASGRGARLHVCRAFRALAVCWSRVRCRRHVVGRLLRTVRPSSQQQLNLVRIQLNLVRSTF